MLKSEIICWKVKGKKGYPLKIRTLDTIHKKSTYVGLKLYLPDLKFWNDEAKEKEKRIRKSFPQKAEFDKICFSNLLEIEKKHSNKNTNQEIKEEIERDRINFMLELQNQIDDLNLVGNFGYVKRFTSLKGHLEPFLKQIKKPTLYFDEITPKFLKRFQIYLYSKNIGNVTQRESYFKGFKKVYNSICEENNLSLINPFASIKYGTDHTKKQKTLSIDVLQNIVDYGFFLTNDIKAFRSRLMFLFSFYGKGIRPGDLFYMRWSDIKIELLDYTDAEKMAIIQAALNKQPKPNIERTYSVVLHYVMNKTGDFVKLRLSVRLLYILCFFMEKDIIEDLLFDSENLVFFEDEDLQLILCQDKFKKPFKDDIEGGKIYQELLNKKSDLIYYDDLKYNLSGNDEKTINRVIKHIKKQQDQTPNEYIFSDINPEIDHKDKRFYSKMSYRKTLYNDGLKLIAEHFKLTIDLTAYVARHTFASTIMNQSHDILLVSKELGHKNTRITETYLKGLNDEKYKADRSNDIIDDILRF